MAYVFGNFVQPGMSISAQDRALADAIARYWTQFAKSGDPNTKDLPHWGAFSARTPQVMHFDGQPHLGEVANLAQLQALDGYYGWRRSQTPAEPPRAH
jgi:para-nitrobenzyl esterase